VSEDGRLDLPALLAGYCMKLNLAPPLTRWGRSFQRRCYFR